MSNGQYQETRPSKCSSLPIIVFAPDLMLRAAMLFDHSTLRGQFLKTLGEYLGIQECTTPRANRHRRSLTNRFDIGVLPLLIMTWQPGHHDAFAKPGHEPIWRSLVSATRGNVPGATLPHVLLATRSTSYRRLGCLDEVAGAWWHLGATLSCLSKEPRQAGLTSITSSEQFSVENR